MASYDTSIRVNTKVDASGLKKVESGLNDVVKSANKLMSALGVGIGIAGLVKLGKEAVELASDIQEVQNVVDVAFKDMSYKMEQFADTCIQQFGLSKLSAKQMGSTFMAMAANMVPSMEKASDMAIALTGRAADMASFYNKTAEETATALKAVFTGETEVLKQYGVIMTEANLQEYAYQKGIKKKISAMTQAEKVQLRYNYVMEQTALAADDFERTSDSWANQTRILSEQFKELLSILGSGLITVLTPVIKGVNQLLSQLIAVANTLGTILSKMLGISSVQVSASGSGAADAYDAATESVDGYTDAVKAADKANKGAVSSFDSLEVINKSASSDSGGSGISAGGSVPLKIEESEGTKSTSALDELFEDLIEKANELKDIFKVGFFDGLGDFEPQIENIKKSLEFIKTSLVGIFTDPEVLTSAYGALEKIVYAAGQITGAYASIGTTIAQNLLGGISMFLEANEDDIKQNLIEMFDIVGELADIKGEFATAFADVFSVFGDENGQSVTGHLIGIFSTAFMEISLLVSNFAVDIVQMICQPFIDNSDGIKTALDGFLGSLSEVLATIEEGLKNTFDKFSEVYDTKIEPFFTSVEKGLSSLLTSFLEFWNGNIQPLLDEWADKTDTLWNESIQPMLDNFITLVGEISDMLTVFWENVLLPLITWFIENVLPVIVPILEGIMDAFFETLASITEVIDGIITTISGITEFLTGVFTGDWEKAWNGIVKIFEGIQSSIKNVINGILSAVESLANGVVDGINMVIRAMNKLSFDIPDWVPELGGKTFGFNLNELGKVSLPRLANGAVIRGGNPFAAILGDQPLGQTNVETPVSTIEDAVARGMEKHGGVGDLTVNLNYDGETFARLALHDILNEMQRQGYDIDILGGTV